MTEAAHIRIAKLEGKLALREKRIEELYGWWEEAEKREAALRVALEALMKEIDSQHDYENLSLPDCWEKARAALEGE